MENVLKEVMFFPENFKVFVYFILWFLNGIHFE